MFPQSGIVKMRTLDDEQQSPYNGHAMTFGQVIAAARKNLRIAALVPVPFAAGGPGLPRRLSSGLEDRRPPLPLHGKLAELRLADRHRPPPLSRRCLAGRCTEPADDPLGRSPSRPSARPDRFGLPTRVALEKGAACLLPRRQAWRFPPRLRLTTCSWRLTTNARRSSRPRDVKPSGRSATKV